LEDDGSEALFSLIIGEIHMSRKNKEIVAKVNAAFAEGSTEGFLSCCAEDVEWTMVGDKTVKGKAAIRKWLAEMGSEPPKFTVDNVIAEGDFVTAHGDMTMKDKEGRLVPYAYCDIYRFRDNKIVALSSFVIKTEAK
jgi:ketosteroid isomerase-like protein